MRLGVLVGLVLLVFAAGLASAELVTYTFEGTVDEVTVWGGTPPWNQTVYVGAPVVGSFAYDADTTVYDSHSVEPPSVYATDSAPLEVMDLEYSVGDFHVGPLASMGDPSQVWGRMEVSDWPAGGGTDIVRVRLFGSSGSVSRWAALGFADSTGAWSLQPGELLPKQLSLADFTGAAGGYQVTDLWTLFQAHFGFSIDSLSPVVSSPEEQLLSLETYIVDQIALGPEFIAPELEAPLCAKIDAALSALARGNPNDAKVAMNDLNALVNQVQAQRDHKLYGPVADEIIERANTIIATLGG